VREIIVYVIHRYICGVQMYITAVKENIGCRFHIKGGDRDRWMRYVYRIILPNNTQSEICAIVSVVTIIIRQ